MTDAQKQFEALFDANYGDVLAYATRRCPSRQDAEDVVAETFAVAWRRLHEIPAGNEARLWLFGTARLVRLNHFRARDRRQRLVDRLRSRLRSEPPGPVKQVSEHDRIQRAFAGLTRTDREILELHVWEELTTNEIAQSLDISVPAVWKRLQRARDRLANALDDDPDRSSTFTLAAARKEA